MKQVKMDGFTLQLDEQGKVLWATYTGFEIMYLYVKNSQGFLADSSGLDSIPSERTLPPGNA